MAGVPKPWVINEKFVKFLWTELSRIWFLELVLLLLFAGVKLLLLLLLLWWDVIVLELGAVGPEEDEDVVEDDEDEEEFKIAWLWPQTGDLSRFRTSMNSSSIWLLFLMPLVVVRDVWKMFRQWLVIDWDSFDNPFGREHRGATCCSNCTSFLSGGAF